MHVCERERERETQKEGGVVEEEGKRVRERKGVGCRV